MWQSERSNMAALRSFGSWSSLCIKASSASNYLHNTTVQRRYAQGVVQSASFLMQQRGKSNSTALNSTM